MNKKKRLGEILIEAGLIDIYQLQSALAHQKQWGGRIGEILVKLGFITEEELLSFLSKHFNLPYVQLKKILPDTDAIKLLSKELATKYNVFPLLLKEELGRKILYIAMADPTNLYIVDELKFSLGCNVRPVISSAITISEAIEYYYNGRGSFKVDKTAQKAKDINFDNLIHRKPIQKKVKKETENNNTDDTLYIFSGGEEKTLSLDNDVVEKDLKREKPVQKTHTNINEDEPVIKTLQLYAMLLDTDAKISSLVKLLIQKKIISKEDYLEKYHKERQKKGNK